MGKISGEAPVYLHRIHSRKKRGKTMQNGIAVSQQQGKINWEMLRKETPEADSLFVMLCLGNGQKKWQKDAWFEYNADACEYYGIPYGIYLKTTVQTEEEAEREAAEVNRMLSHKKGTIPEFPVFIKPEAEKAMLAMTAEERGRLMECYGKEIMQEGSMPGLCANKYWCTHLFADKRIQNWGKWIIQHYKECSYSGAYMIWQYSSMGMLHGIEGYVELLKPWKKTQGRPNLHGYIGDSLVGALNTKGYPSDYTMRGKYAVYSGLVERVQDYRGTSEQNRNLLRKLGGTVSASRILRVGIWVRLKPKSQDLTTGKPFGQEFYRNTLQIVQVSGTTITLGIHGKIVGKVNRHSIIVV